MCLINWYGNYTPRVSEIAEPLHRLKRKDVVWEWILAFENSYQMLKGEIKQGGANVLKFP